MATKIGPKTVTQRDRSKNLVFCIDAAHSDSYGGEPAANLFVDPNNFGGADWNVKNGTWAAYSDPGPHGNGCYSCTATDSDPYIYSYYVRHVGTGNVTFSCWVKGVGATVGMGGDIRINNGSSSGQATIANTTVNYTITGNWQRVSVTQNCTGAGTIKVGVETPNSATAGHVVLVSDPQLEQGQATTPFTATNRRSGTVSGEILADGGFETWGSSTDLTHWVEYNAGSSTTNQDSTHEVSGTYCVRLDVDASDNNVHIYTSVACFAPGVRYRVTFSAKCSSGTCTASLYESNGSTVPNAGLNEDLALTTSYQSFSFDFNALGYNGANQHLLFGRKLSGGGASKSLYFDNASVVELGATAITNISGVGSENTALTGTFATYGLGGLFRPTTRNVLASEDSNRGHIGAVYWDLDGSDEYIDCGGVDLGPNATLLCWFKTDENQNNKYLIAQGLNLTGSNGFDLGFHTTPVVGVGSYCTIVGGGASSVFHAVNYYDNPEWHMLAASYDGTKNRLYYDGELVTTGATAAGGINIEATNLLRIGSWVNSPASSHANAQIALVMAWSAGLTTKEIKDIYIAQKGRFGK